MNEPRNLPATLTWVVVVLFCLWVLYLLYKIAEHVQAWPFG